jgi:putative DNA methylase
MIRYAQGDIFDTPADIRVNTVNCVGVMGAGVALAFKNRYPEMFKKYAKACKAGEVRPGKPHVWEKSEFDEIVTVVNLPTKDHWRQPSEYEYVEKGLRWLREFVEKRGKVRVALPALGCGHGGLDWSRVQKMIEAALGDLAAEIIVFEPSSSHAAGERLDESTLARLEELGIKRLRSGDPGYPEALRGRSGATVYLKGDVESLKGPMVAVIPSIQPSEREIQGVVACVRELANPSVHILTGYSAKADRPVIRTALEQGAHVIICLVEGILLFNIRRDLQDVWDEDRVTVLSSAKPQQKWYPGGVGKATAIKLSLANVSLISDPYPKWLSSFVHNGTDGIRSKMFYLDYGGMQENIKAYLRKLNAKPLGRSRESGKPNVAEVLAALQLAGPPQEAIEITPTVHEPKIDKQEPVPIEKTEGEASVTYPKRLIEVDLPIKRISAHARREKDMRLGHIPSMHIYPAARPPAACRAVICAALWPDPVDPLCPPAFLQAAESELRSFAKEAASNRNILEMCDNDAWRRYCEVSKKGDSIAPKDLRGLLLDFIADFASWEASTDPHFLQTARSLTQTAHEALGGIPGTRPLVMDPFAGGGAIPLESLRVGADAFASDLNPVAVILNKVVLEYVPKYGERLIDEISKWERWAQDKAREELADFYPCDPNGAVPIAYLWARVITCEGPGCGAEIPLMKSFCLARKRRSVALKAQVDDANKRIEFSILQNPKASDIRGATVARGSATCPCCGYTTPASSVRSQLKKQRGGSNDARMFVVVTSTVGERGRTFRIANDDDKAAYERAASRLSEIRHDWTGSPSLVPEEPTPIGGGHGAGRAFSQRSYGMDRWEDLFNKRQLLSLTTYTRLAREYVDRLHDKEFAAACSACLGLIIDRLADLNAALCVWQLNTPNTAHVFGRWALQLTWDYGEVNPLADAGGSPKSAIGRMVRSIANLASAKMHPGHIERSSADKHPLPDDAAAAFITDPPYYDAVPYSDLLDFFYVWLKRSLSDEFSNLTSNEVGPKDDECIVDEIKGKDNAYYEATMQRAMAEGRRVLCPTGVGVVVFAHKSTGGWEAQLQAMVNAGLTITGSWPIDTEMGSRLRAKGSAALASSVHLVCRPRENQDGNIIERVGDWRDVLSELPGRIGQWLPRLAAEGVVGADAIFACLGPALEIFSRYSSVEKASGEIVPLREYLEQVWAEVARQALNMIFEDADASGFEEDARLTAMWLWTLRTDANGNGEDDDKTVSLPGYSLEYDAARKIAQGLGCHLENLTHLVEVKGDKAMLLSAESRARYLFGKEDLRATAKRRKKKDGPVQQNLFSLLGVPDEEEAAAERAELERPPAGKTALDQLHQAMLLFTAGRGAALKRFLVDDGIGANPQFWTLAQAFSALYPSNTNEKRWVDGVLARKKGLGF